ncbi:hypothetical protein JCM19239_5753 [Vibrio variabilis]|uniref:Uncharacterized protein n=1 Tax=Vibrio variabilis TaxID=990271 RepID=A0ABQ0JII6_9VIBR|nr:hypothetical protein JCM19239_5753 [Vibrio variabilis]
MSFLFRLFPFSHGLLVNPERERTSVDQGVIVLAPVGVFVTRLRHEIKVSK